MESQQVDGHEEPRHYANMWLTEEQVKALQRVRQVEGEAQLWRPARGCMQPQGDEHMCVKQATPP